MVIVCGCGKRPASQATNNISNPPPELAVAPAATDTSSQATNQDTEPIKRSSLVDMVIHNGTTNSFALSLCPIGSDRTLGSLYLKPGETVTNGSVDWRYWPKMDFLYLCKGATPVPGATVSLAEANKKISPDGYAKVGFNISSSFQVEVDYANIEGMERAPAPVSAQMDTQAMSQASSQGMNSTLVDLVIHNCTTNDYSLQFDRSSGPDVPLVFVASAETTTNQFANWAYWPVTKIMLLNNQGQKSFAEVSLAEVNQKISSTNHYYQVYFQVLGPDEVQVECK